MIYELCTKAATFITDRHLDSARGKQASFQDQRRKREEEQAKVSHIDDAMEKRQLTLLIIYRLRKKQS